MRCVWLVGVALSCNSGADHEEPTSVPATEDPTDPTSPEEILSAFVGSPCVGDADCPYPGGTCLTEEDGFPVGTCSAPCDQFCPDAVGYPTTFCVDGEDLPVAPASDGMCLQRCDFEAFPYRGCRDDHGCVEVARANDAERRTYVCLPGDSALTPCLSDLAARGVPFVPTLIPDRSPTDAPTAVCHVEEPIAFQSGYRGVDLIFHQGTSPGEVLGACSFGHAVADTLEGVADDGVVVLRHLGAYGCRTIAGSTTLSRHGLGDALDISGFDFADGSRVTLTDDWEHDTTTFDNPAGAWLYDTAQGWHADLVWTIVLTPNYNLDHSSHFHVDLTPGEDFIGFAGPGYFGPAPYVD